MNRSIAVALILVAPALGCVNTGSLSNPVNGGPDGSAPPDGSFFDGPQPPPLNCDSYCNGSKGIMQLCTGSNSQYESNEACMTACANWQVGSQADTSGNTLSCRMWHLSLATTIGYGFVPHCWHAGPFGYSGSGGCGDNCTNLCTIAVPLCGPGDGGYTGTPLSTFADMTTCLAACADAGLGPLLDAGDPAGFFAAADGGGPAAGNTLDCREFQLSNALTGGSNQNADCPNAGGDAGVPGQPCQ